VCFYIRELGGIGSQLSPDQGGHDEAFGRIDNGESGLIVRYQVSGMRYEVELEQKRVPSDST
jgi:hypothetical protein